MPRGDGTGPEGKGPLTGRGGGARAVDMTPRGGRSWLGRLGLGLRRGRGRGRGWRRMFHTTGLPFGARSVPAADQQRDKGENR